MKRFSAVAVALLLAASSSFASWDYFPPKDAGQGEAKLELAMPHLEADGVTTLNLPLSARYTIIDGLEASLVLPINMSQTDNDDYAGLAQPTLGVRYWLMDLGLGFFADLVLPFHS